LIAMPKARLPASTVPILLATMLRTPSIQRFATIARMRAQPCSSSGLLETGTFGSIRTSGWVMKKNYGHL